MKKFILIMAIIIGLIGLYFYNYVEKRQQEPEKFYAVIVDMDADSMTVCVVKNSRSVKIKGRTYQVSVGNATDYTFNYDDYYYLDTKKFVKYTWKDATCSRNEFEIGDLIKVNVKSGTYKDIGTAAEESLAKVNATIPKEQIVSIQLIKN